MSAPSRSDSCGSAGTRMLSVVGPMAVIAINRISRPQGFSLVCGRSCSRLALISSTAASLLDERLRCSFDPAPRVAIDQRQERVGDAGVIAVEPGSFVGIEQ